VTRAALAPELLSELRDLAVEDGNAAVALEVCTLLQLASGPARGPCDVSAEKAVAVVARELAAGIARKVARVAEAHTREDIAEVFLAAHRDVAVLERALSAVLRGCGRDA